MKVPSVKLLFSLFFVIMVMSTALLAQLRIRKQAHDLTIRDLEDYPVWEFIILGEKGAEDQDEATVRPKPDLTEITEFTGRNVVRAEFTAADGTSFAGVITPNKTMHFGSIHPVIITPDGQVLFWYGEMKPTSSEIKTNYKILKKTAKQLFPLKFRSRIPIRGGINTGTIPGFLYQNHVPDFDNPKSTIIK